MSARTPKAKAQRSLIHSVRMIEQLRSDRIDIENTMCDLADAAKALADVRAACSFIGINGAQSMVIESDKLHDECAHERAQLARKLTHIEARHSHHCNNVIDQLLRVGA